MKRVDGKDWCTMFPDRVAKINMSDICAAHDKRYADKSKSRWTADLELFNDVKNRGEGLKKIISYPLATVMWIGVRVCGWYWY